jgi:hypothetical protein
MVRPLAIALLSVSLVPPPQRVEVTTSKGSATLKSEADLKEIGLPVYPGSRLREDSKESAQTTVAFWISDKGFRLVVVKYESRDNSEKILAYYRKALTKFGTVLQCPSGDTTPSGLTCKDHETKPGEVDLMAGSTEIRRIVGVEPAPRGGGTRFELVYLRAKGVEAH